MEQVIVRRRHSLGWPLILIAIGVIFLLSNTGILSGDVWSIVLRFWPLIFIIGGLDRIYRGEGLAWALFSITLGSIILLNNLGYLAWDIWGVFFRFWPVLIIVIGIDIILGKYYRSPWAAVIGLLLVTGIVGGLLLVAGKQPVLGQLVPMESVSQPLGDLERAEIAVSPAIGRISVHDTSDPAALIKGNFEKSRMDQVEEASTFQNGTASYTLRSHGTIKGPLVVDQNLTSWDIGLTRAVPVSFNFSLGVGEANLLLTNIQLTNLKVSTGIGETTVLLPKSGDFEVVIDGAIGQTILQVPANLPVRIITSRGISGLAVHGDLIRNDNVITSRTYAGAAEQVDVHINQAIGDLVVETVP